MLQKLLRFVRNFYVATALALLTWMTFFDANDLPLQARNWLKLRELEEETTFYQAEMRDVQPERREVLGSNRLREKFAREEYLMKKPTDDALVSGDELNDPLPKEG